MEIQIKEIRDPEIKSLICAKVLRALPAWFGIESSIVEYGEKVKNLPFYAVFDSDNAVGFVAVKVHNRFTAEVCVMGILEEYHGRGIGRRLIECCENYCENSGREFLTVKTLDESACSKNYEKTRMFYESAGFKPLEVLPLHWDKDNPCLFLAKHINVKK